MKHLDLKIDDKVYQRLLALFNNDEKAVCDFVSKTVTDKIKTLSIDNSAKVSKNNKSDLEDYLKSENLGSRSYGIKGQGW